MFEESGEVKQRDFEAKMKETIAEMRNEQVEIEKTGKPHNLQTSGD